MSLTNPNTPVSQQDLQDFYHKILPYMGGGESRVILQVLTEGTAQVTFTGIPTEGNYIVNFYTSNGTNHRVLDVSTAGQATLTFDVQSEDITVFCEIKEVQV